MGNWLAQHDLSCWLGRKTSTQTNKKNFSLGWAVGPLVYKCVYNLKTDSLWYSRNLFSPGSRVVDNLLFLKEKCILRISGQILKMKKRPEGCMTFSDLGCLTLGWNNSYLNWTVTYVRLHIFFIATWSCACRAKQSCVEARSLMKDRSSVDMTQYCC